MQSERLFQHVYVCVKIAGLFRSPQQSNVSAGWGSWEEAPARYALITLMSVLLASTFATHSH